MGRARWRRRRGATRGIGATGPPGPRAGAIEAIAEARRRVLGNLRLVERLRRSL